MQGMSECEVILLIGLFWTVIFVIACCIGPFLTKVLRMRPYRQGVVWKTVVEVCFAAPLCAMAAIAYAVCFLLELVTKSPEDAVFYGPGVISQLDSDAPPPLSPGTHQPPARSGSGQGRESG